MITIKQNDNGIGIIATLSNKNGAVDLTNASVLFLFDGHELTPTIEDAVTGKVVVVFESPHTAKPGTFAGEFEVTFADSRKETYPSNDYVKLKILRDIGGR